MIRKDLLDIIRILAKKHFPIMITNGWYITDENARNLWEAGLQEISVSVDYADPEKHDRQRGMKGSFDRAIAALEFLNKSRPTPRNRVHMISVLMEDNVDDIENLILLSKKIGVTYMINLYSYQRGKKNERLPRQELTRHLLNLKKKYPHFVSLTAYLNRIDDAIHDGGIGNCQAGKYYMNIDNYGNVARCTEMTDMPVGNILREEPESIKNKLYAAQRKNACAQCWTSCRGWAESMHGSHRLQTWKEFYISVKEYQ
jgi:radical SAM protein with 4Fe4S-binding SPASM domain